MADEDLIYKYMDGTIGEEDSRRFLSEMKKNGELGELLLSEAAAALLDSSEEIGNLLSSEGIAESEELCKDSYSDGNTRIIGYSSDMFDTPSIAAEDEPDYGK